MLLKRIPEIIGPLRPVLRDTFEINAKQISNFVGRYVRVVAAELEQEHGYVKYRQEVLRKGQRGLDVMIKNEYMSFVADSSTEQRNNQEKLADLRYPIEWYPEARNITREFHLHVGPTNSGKTYHALKRLESAESGCYAGPLRLLAHEVYTRMNAGGISCSLITGDERRPPTTEGWDANGEDHAPVVSCTVEMTPMGSPWEVAVIDEIQMIGDSNRGWAWTQAVLGVNAKEVHLCGEVRAVPLIKELLALTGDKLHIHEYERLSPLEMAPASLKDNLKSLRKGDCVVVFSVMGIHAMRNDIQRATGKKVAIVYGSLPAETRAQQAALFNDPDNDYDILVASDAIGMGLNL
jgi:ATP-dependent RNA helicase SUPV3L1/SUV3